MEVARLTAEVDIRTRERDESREKVGRMNGLCRRQVSRILKQQRGQFKKECRKQSRRAVKVVQRYMESRRPWNRVDKLLSQAGEAERILRRLQADGVPIPEEKVADVVTLKQKYLVERAQIEEKALSAQDFEFILPSGLGVPNLDQLDFTGGFAFGDEDGVYLGDSGDDEGENEDEASVEGVEGEEESEEWDDEGEEEEEGEVPLVTKGATSGVRPDSENPNPVPEVGVTTQDAREGGEEDRSAATAVRTEDRSGVGSVPIVPTVADGSQLVEGETLLRAEDATVVVRPEGDGSGVVPLVGEKTQHGDQPGGSGSEEVPRVGEETPTGGATSGVPEEGERERVQLEGDVSPPEVEG